MSARRNIHQLKTKLDSTFERARSVEDLELQSDLARYLCVLVSGYLETATVEWLLHHSRDGARPTIQKYVESKLKRFTNANASKIIALMASWDSDWYSEMNNFLVDEKKDAVDSVIALRNNIAHGQWVGVTLNRISNYYIEVDKVVTKIGELSVPEN
jgi:hypothetical protein